METFDKWKFAAQVLAVAGGLSYWGYLSYMHTLIDVCDNLQRAFGVGSFDGNSGEINLSRDQTSTFLTRSPSLMNAVKTCIKDGHAPNLGLADEQ